ncbi:Hypothetical_protein [Hexamita inflata]|uniref:Hypothetical_protein n=1 Tax=Hexamita inflata TaxID=28002 RepID=A0AA86S2B8_9EUKA|nr:Hypothetical protein HINF_LOCUS64420 [Hexamita inflata]
MITGAVYNVSQNKCICTITGSIASTNKCMCKLQVQTSTKFNFYCSAIQQCCYGQYFWTYVPNASYSIVTYDLVCGNGATYKNISEADDGQDYSALMCSQNYIV